MTWFNLKTSGSITALWTWAARRWCFPSKLSSTRRKSPMATGVMESIPTAVIDFGAFEQKRRQLECREQQRHRPHHRHTPEAKPTRHLSIRYQRQQAYRKRAHVSVDQMSQERETQERSGENQAPATPNGLDGQTDRDQEEMVADRLGKQPAASPCVAAILHAIEEIRGDQRRQHRRRRGRERSEAHEPSRHKEA